jgi:hypothetical protein
MSAARTCDVMQASFSKIREFDEQLIVNARAKSITGFGQCIDRS